MFLIDSFAYKNKLVSVHPAEKMLFAISSMLICVLSKSVYLDCFVLILMTFLTIVRAGINWKFYIKLLLFPLSFLFLGIVSIAITSVSSSMQSLVSFKILSIQYAITSESLNTAIILFFRSISAVSCLYFMILTTPMLDIIFILRKLRVPELILDLVNLMYRLIFIMVTIIMNVYTSQSSRLGYKSIKNKYKSLGYLVSTLFILAYKKANNMFIALESRCYSGTLNMIELKYPLSYKNIVLIVCVECILAYLALITTK